MRKIDWEKEREDLDRLITLFHFKKAEKKIKKCIRKAKKTHQKFYFLYFRAQEKILKEDFLSAIKYLKECLTIKKDPLVYNDLGIAYAELEDFAQAKKFFHLGLKNFKDYPTLYHNYGWFLNLCGEHKKAIVVFSKVLEIEPKRAETLFNLGDSYEQLNEKVKAKKYFLASLNEVKGKSKFLSKEINKRLKNL